MSLCKTIIVTTSPLEIDPGQDDKPPSVAFPDQYAAVNKAMWEAVAATEHGHRIREVRIIFSD